MARFDQNKITFEDSNNVDQYEVELVNGTELKVTHLPTGNSWKFDDDNDGTLTANALEAGVSITDPADNTITDFVGRDLTLDNGTLKAITSPDVRTSLNDLFIQNAEQDFELGLSQLDYRDGQFEVFADDSKIASSTGLDLVLGSPLNDAGYVALQKASIGDISVEQGTFTGHTSDVFRVRVDGQYGYSSSDDSTVQKWDAGTMSGVTEFTEHSDRIRALAVGTEFGYSGDGFYDIYKWDKDTLSQDGIFDQHGSNIYSIDVDDTYGYSVSSNSVKKWDKDTLTEEASISQSNGHTLVVDDTHIFIAASDNSVYKLNKSDLTQADIYDLHSNDVYSVDVDSNYGYSGSRDSNLHKWDKNTLSQSETNTNLHQGFIFGIKIFDDYGVSVDDDGTVVYWNKSDLSEIQSYNLKSDFLRSVDITTNNNFIYAGGVGGDVEKIGEDIAAETNGNAQHVQQDIGFVPNTAVISDDLRQLPTGTDVYYEISDDAGNTVTVQRSDIDGEVDVSALTSSNISTTAYLERPDTDTASPELDAWALYLNE